MPDNELKALLRAFGVEEIAPGSLFAVSSASDPLLRGWRVALERAWLKPHGRSCAWIRENLARLACEPVDDQPPGLAAEVDAALRLTWVGQVRRIAESAKRASPDFNVEGVDVEVYCPQDHGEERRVAKIDVEQQLADTPGPVRVATTVTYPTTGSGRRVDKDGAIWRNPNSQALAYPANKLIDRLLHKKRSGAQFSKTRPSILWLDLKHGLRQHALDCVPFRSVVSKGSCFTGTHGVWHAFYAQRGEPLFKERTALEWPVPVDPYVQQKQGWFREIRKVSAAILSVQDGVLIFENPWADITLDDDARRQFASLSEFRPEHSWFGEPRQVERHVADVLDRICWLVQWPGAGHGMEIRTATRVNRSSGLRAAVRRGRVASARSAYATPITSRPEARATRPSCTSCVANISGSASKGANSIAVAR